MRVIGTRHLHMALVNMAKAMVLAVAIVSITSAMVIAQVLSPSESSTTEQPSAGNSGTKIEVQGYGSQAPTTGGATLQGASPVKQSDSTSNNIQNSSSNLDSLQPSSGRTDF